MVLGSFLPLRGQIALFGLAVAGVGGHTENSWLVWLGFGVALAVLAPVAVRSVPQMAGGLRWARRIGVAAVLLVAVVVASGALVNSGVPALSVLGRVLFTATVWAALIALVVASIAAGRALAMAVVNKARDAVSYYGFIWVLVREHYAPIARTEERP
jgi:hypothetical protein